MMQVPSLDALPSTRESEQKIEEKRTQVLRYLSRKDALDLAEVLGLENSTKESK